MDIWRGDPHVSCIIILAIVTIFIIIPLLMIHVFIIVISSSLSHHIDTSDPLVFGGIGETVLKGLEGHWQTQPTQLAVK